MSLADGQAALIRRIVAYASKPALGLPNAAAPALSDAVPVRWIIQAAGGGQRQMGASTGTDAAPEIVVRVETVDGIYATASDASVDALVALFPVGLRIEGVAIERAPQPRPPLEGDGVYSVPVIIRGRFFF